MNAWTVAAIDLALCVALGVAVILQAIRDRNP